MVTHFEVEVLYGTLYQPACQQNQDAFSDTGREVRMTDRDEEVTCKRCLKALGYDLPAKDAQEALLDLTVQQLTGETYRVAA